MRRETFPIIIKRTTFRRDPQVWACFLFNPTIRIGPSKKENLRLAVADLTILCFFEVAIARVQHQCLISSDVDKAFLGFPIQSQSQTPETSLMAAWKKRRRKESRGES